MGSCPVYPPGQPVSHKHIPRYWLENHPKLSLSLSDPSPHFASIHLPIPRKTTTTEAPPPYYWRFAIPYKIHISSINVRPLPSTGLKSISRFFSSSGGGWRSRIHFESVHHSILFISLFDNFFSKGNSSFPSLSLSSLSGSYYWTDQPTLISATYYLVGQ